MKKLALTVFLLMFGLPIILNAQEPSVTETILFDFTGASTGYWPDSPMTQCPSGTGLMYGATATSQLSDWGTVVSFNPTTHAELVIWASPNGSTGFPNGPLACDGSGNLYVATLGIGDSGGAVVKLTNSGGTWSPTTLHTFAGGTTDGLTPGGGVVLDASANVYLTTQYGGTGTACGNGCGTIYKLTKSGSTYNGSIVHDFVGTDGSLPIGPLTLAEYTSCDSQAQQVHIFGTTELGGANNDGTVFDDWLAAGTCSAGFKSLYSFTGGNDGANPLGGIYFPKNNSLALIGTAKNGGTLGYGTIFAITGLTNSITVLHSFADSDGANPSGSVIADVSGNLYGTTPSGGSGVNGPGTIFKLTLQTSGNYTFSVDYNFKGTGSDGVSPSGVIISSSVMYFTTRYGGTNSCGGNGCGTIGSLTGY